MPLLHSPDRTWDYPAITSVFTGDLAVSWENWRYLSYAGGGEELYDLERDPHEMNNLALDKKTNGDLIIAMNDKLNKVIEDEVGKDMGEYLPDIKGVNWAFERFDP